MKLGQAVSFTKELKKTKNNVHIEDLEERGLESEWIERFKVREHELTQEGIIVGKRNVAERTLVEIVEKVRYEDLCPIGIGEFETQATETERIPVYLVATDLRGLRQVRPKDLEKIEEETVPIYRCNYCNKRFLTKEGKKFHEKDYCYKSPYPTKKKLGKILNCEHEFQTQFRYIPGEAVMEPSHDECIKCGIGRGEAEEMTLKLHKKINDLDKRSRNGSIQSV